MKLVFATHNLHKLKEVKAMLPESFELLSLSDIGCDEDIPETALTIEGNAMIKATYVKENYGYDCFADDTGLEVFSLNNEPGVYSARYAGPENNADANTEKLLKNLVGIKKREAQFKTAISLIFEGKEELFLGSCKGIIIDRPRGNEGFGYDPIFQPSGSLKTMAELSPQEKSEIGHRGKATRKLIAFLSK